MKLPGAKLKYTGRPVQPATVVCAGTRLSRELLEDKFAQFEQKDDVFQTGFYQHGKIIVQMRADVASCSIPPNLADLLKMHNSELIIVFVTDPIPEGPYFLRNGSLHQAWRLYEDKLSKFDSAVVPADDCGNFQ